MNNTEKNNISFSFRSYVENHDIDLNVRIEGEHFEDKKIAKLLNTFLAAINSTCRVTYEAK